MKKSIFAVAVASVLTLGAAHAETVLYGSIRYDYQSKKDNSIERDTKNNLTKFTSQRVSNLNDAGSRIGLKGSEDLGNNNAVIYNLEWGFDGMTQDESKGWKTRKAILGLTGDWGTFTAGRQDNPFKVTVVDDSVTDNFNGGDVISSAAQRAMTTALTGQGIAIHNVEYTIDPTDDSITTIIEPNYDSTISNASLSRVGKVIAYTTPEWAGFQANVALMMDDAYYGHINKSKNVDLWTINARYAYEFANAGTLLAKVGYIEGKTATKNTVGWEDTKKSKVWGIFLGYDQDAFGVTFDYAKGNYKPNYFDDVDSVIVEGEKIKSQGWDIGGRFSFGPNYYSSIRVAYGENQIKQAGAKDKLKSWAVGFEQKLSSRTRAWVEYGAQETKFAQDVDFKSDKRKDNVISIGMRHDF